MLTLLAAISTYGQWTVYNTSNSSIPENSIWDLAVDSSNAIWLATDYGAARFDGNSWTIYDVNNSPIPASSNNDIFAVFVDDQDHIWFGTDGGYLLEFDYLNNVWIDHTTFTFGDIHVIRQDLDGHMWVGHANGVQERIGAVWTEYQTNLPNVFVESIDIDQNNTVWIGTNGGVAEYDNVSQWTNYTDANTSMTGNIWTESVQVGIGNDIWVGTRGGVYLFDQNGNWTKFNSSNSGLLDDEVNSIEVDTDGIVWVANDAASMGVYENSLWTPINFPFNVSFARVIIIDNDGYKWLGTASGLIKYNLQGSGNIPTIMTEARSNPIGLSVFPNPASDRLSVVLEFAGSGSIKMELLDLQGRTIDVLAHKPLSIGRFNFEYDTSGIPVGTYLLSVRSNGSPTTTQLIVVQ